MRKQGYNEKRILYNCYSLAGLQLLTARPFSVFRAKGNEQVIAIMLTSWQEKENSVGEIAALNMVEIGT